MYATAIAWVLTIGLACPWVEAAQCVGIDMCRCIFDDGSGVIDITSLGNTDGTPR
jgi:hypothetical protein